MKGFSVPRAADPNVANRLCCDSVLFCNSTSVGLFWPQSDIWLLAEYVDDLLLCKRIAKPLAVHRTRDLRDADESQC